MESNLNLSMAGLTGECGSFLGWGRDATRWTTAKAQDVRANTESALRRFYYQAKVGPNDEVHGWTFLKPVATIILTANEKNAPLPDDYGGFEGMAAVTLNGTSGGYHPLQQVHEEQIRTLYAAQKEAVGRPQFYAEEQIKGTTAITSNRSRFLVYPKPDQAYVLTVPYYFLSDYITTLNPYPYGGAAHAETMKAGVRAAAELFMDGQKGEQEANYMQALAASISYDRRHQPKTLGVNVDRSDRRAYGRGRWPDGLWNDPRGIGFLGEAHI